MSRYDLGDRIIEKMNGYFRELLTDQNLDGAIVTTGVFNPDIRVLLDTGHFRLLPVYAGAGD